MAELLTIGCDRCGVRVDIPYYGNSVPSEAAEFIRQHAAHLAPPSSDPLAVF